MVFSWKNSLEMCIIAEKAKMERCKLKGKQDKVHKIQEHIKQMEKDHHALP